MTAKRPKLLMVVNHIDWFWSHRYPLAKAAQDAGYDVCVAVHGAEKDRRLIKDGFTPLELPAWKQGWLLPFYVLHIMATLFMTILITRPDLIHAITLKYCFMAGVPARLLRRKIIHTIAGRGYLFSEGFIKARLMRLAAGPFLMAALRSSLAQVIFQNSDDRDLMIAKSYVRPEQANLISGSGVDISKFIPVPPPRTKTKTVGLATRLVQDKGVDIFIEAAKILIDRGVKANFVIAGEPSPSNPASITAEEMTAMIADSPVTWLGKVSDMPGFYNACHIIAYPSHYCEGVPKVLLEAAASGRSIITTDHPGCRDAVRHKQNGLLVPIKSPRDTANAIERLLDNADLRRRMGQKSRDIAEKEFDQAIITAKTLDIYAKTLA